ncbi:MAG: hypothetical protein VX951_01785, partial [Planctomycetota bacterium]|nr:hypothetical protein [Planctomycetota bacterium]
AGNHGAAPTLRRKRFLQRKWKQVPATVSVTGRTGMMPACAGHWSAAVTILVERNSGVIFPV